MSSFLHRTTKQYRTSVSPNALPEPIANYIQDPDVSAVAGQPTKYWIITGDIVTLMGQAARDSVDAIELDARKSSIADELDQTQTIIRAFAEVVLDEINLLRNEHALAPRTLAQLKTAVRNKL